MKTIVILCFVLMTATPSFANEISDYDYATVKHIAAGAVVATAVTEVMPEDSHIALKVGAGILASLLLGLAIESTDDPFTASDILEYGAGGVGASLIFNFAF